MIDKIYVFDDIIEKPYQNKIKSTLIGGETRYNHEDFPWYYIDDASLQLALMKIKKGLEPFLMIMFIMKRVLIVIFTICL